MAIPLKTKWFLIGFAAACSLAILYLAHGFIRASCYYYGTTLQSTTINLPQGGAVVHTYYSIHLPEALRDGHPGHTLTLLMADGSWTNYHVPREFAGFVEFAFASSPDRRHFWLIDTEQAKWVECDSGTGVFRALHSGCPPGFDKTNCYLRVTQRPVGP